MLRLLKLLPLVLMAALLWWFFSPSGPFAPEVMPKPARPAARPVLPPQGVRLQTAHYLIQSSASAEETQLVADRVEALRDAFVRFFSIGTELAPAAPMQLYLYGTRSEFKDNNRSRPWAEAYYLKPVCHAYFSRLDANPYHWMLHEATHQLSRELAGFPRRRWVDEGLATYFGTSQFVDGKLAPGRIDPSTYPVWWLWELGPSGDLQQDKRSGRIVPLRVLITDQGSEGIAVNVNGYYLGYWSLARFLLQADGGRHAPGFRKAISEGGTVESFERNIGRIDEVEKDWYQYFLKLRQSGARIAEAP